MSNVEERHGLAHPRLDVAVDHDPAVARDAVRHQQVVVAEVPREQRRRKRLQSGMPALARCRWTLADGPARSRSSLRSCSATTNGRPGRSRRSRSRGWVIVERRVRVTGGRSCSVKPAALRPSPCSPAPRPRRTRACTRGGRSARSAPPASRPCLSDLARGDHEHRGSPSSIGYRSTSTSRKS